MTLKDNYKTILNIILSVYLFLQCTFFIEKPAHFLFNLTAPKIGDALVSFFPNDLIPYYNFVFYTGLLLSGIFFVFAALPFVKKRIGNKIFVSVPLTIALSPFYFIFLYLIASSISKFF